MTGAIAMAEPKTKLTTASVDDFLGTIESDQVRDDCRTIAGIMEKAARAPGRMWGSSIVQQELLKKLGTHSCGKGCVSIKRLSDVHMPTLTKLVKSSVAYARKSQPS